jgi:D-3-phosphoglycerate dehydrogenase
MNSAPVVLVGPADYATLCPTGRRMLIDAGIQLVENPYDRPLEPEELIAIAPNITGAIVGVEQWDSSLLDAAGGLRILTKLGVGVDNIDLSAARQRGVDVTNAPGGNANAVAELALGLMIAVLRSIPQMHTSARQGTWERRVGPELTGKTVGLVGFGAIGRLLARRLAGFDVELIAWDPYPDADAASSLGVRLVELDEVFSSADLLSLHVPALPSTRHLVGERTLALMKPSAYLINTARGALVDENALVAALDGGRLAGAALDVFEVEPVPLGHPLTRHPRTVTTSHGAADSVEAYEAIGVINATAIIDALAGRTARHIVNTEV